jgi:hypothetical protein
VQQLPALRSGLGRATRARLGVFPSIASSATALAGDRRGLPASVLRRAAPVVRRQAYVQVPPARLFGEEAIALHGRLDHLLFVASHDRDEVTVEPVDGAAVAERMRASLVEERSPFLQMYRQFRFLFPGRPAAAVEQAPAIEERLLAERLGDRRAHVLRHPYPVRFASLLAPVEAVLRGEA